MLNKKEKVLNYCTQDPSAAEYFHDYYTDMMNDIRILGKSDFLKLSGNELDAEKYIVVDVSPITYIEVSNIYSISNYIRTKICIQGKILLSPMLDIKLRVC